MNSRRSNIFFPSSGEEQGLQLWLIGAVILVFMIIMIFILDYFRRKRAKAASRKKSKTVKQGDDKRKYFRIDTLMFAKVHLGYKEYRCEIRDISGGGMSFFTNLGPDRLRSSMVLNSVSFNIPQWGRVVVNAVVRRIQPTKHKNPAYSHLCGVEFLHISDYNRELIIKYIHSRQRTNLRATRSITIE